MMIKKTNRFTYHATIVIPDDKRKPRLHKWQKTLEDCND